MDRDLREELEAHRAMRQADLEARGFSESDASHASRRALGNITRAREDARGVWISPWLQSIRQDVGYALRVVRRSPAFAAAIVAVMSLGIGATTAVFSLLDGLVFKDLPVHRADRLVYLTNPAFTHGIFQEVGARGAHVFSSVAGWNLADTNVEWTAELEPAEVLIATGNFYGTLGITAVAGRTFGPEDDRPGGGAQGLVAVISYGCWQRRFGGEMSAIGRTIRIDRRPFTIVGVTPPSFTGVTPGLAPEITIPLTSFATPLLHILARLRDGLTIAEADAALQVFWPAVLEATTSAKEPPDRRARFLSRQTRLDSGRAGYSRIRNQFEEPLWMLLALVGLLMTVACASAANLLLARGVARRKEIAVRLAIGAGRPRLVRQMLTEAAVWTTLAAIVGVGFATQAGAALTRMMTTTDDLLVIDVTPNWRMAAFALALAFLTAAVCALVPAFNSTRLDPGSTLKGARTAVGGLFGRWSLSKTLVTAQVALTIVLLVGAALLIRSLQRILTQDAGFQRDRVLVLSTDPKAADYQAERLRRFYDGLIERLGALPGVETASLSWYPPITGQDGMWTQTIETDGTRITPTAATYVYFNAVSLGYFRTLGMRLVQGRDFGNDDSASAPRVVAVNESLARRFFAGRNPIGRRITLGLNKSRRDLEIVAVVSDAKYQRLQEEPRSVAYLPWPQLGEMAAGVNLHAEVRTAGPAGAMAHQMRAEVRALDPRVPMRVESVDDRIRQSLVRERVTTFLAAGLGAAALALACAGLYGLLAYAVSRQSYEIGLRLALGAERSAVLWLVMRECLLLAAIGTVAGLGFSLALSRYVRSFLYQVSPTDSIALSAAALLMLAVAALAGSIPARRAARIDPMVALRHE
jgi:putative ABC transport system permease protein